jgi:hypothetical protein
LKGVGVVLLLFVIFKGKPNGCNGCIAKNKFATYPTANLYCCQDASWMAKAVMIAWVNKVLKPYLATALDEDVIPHLILDSCQCQMMTLVVHRIQELWVEVQNLMGGCTSVYQPDDVGF